MRRFRRVVGLGIVSALIALGLRPTAIGVWLEDGLALKCLFAVRGTIKPPRDVVVVSIDKTAADQLGLKKDLWPPPRHIHADVVRSLSRHGVSAIVMDIFFKDRRTLDEDQDLANAIAESGKVALFESIDRLNYGAGEIVQTRSPISLFRNAAVATGVFPLPDTDVRAFWTFFDATDGRIATLPAVGLQIHALPLADRMMSLLQTAGIKVTDVPAQVATASDSQRLMAILRRELGNRPDTAKQILRSLQQGPNSGLTNDERRDLAALVELYGGDDMRYLNFYGPAGTITTIPFHKLVTSVEDPILDLQGTVAFVGEGAWQLLTNPDQRDTYRTVYSKDGVDLSGAEIAATAFANLLTNRTLRRTPFLLEIVILSAFALVVASLSRSLRWLYGGGAVLLFGCVYYAAAQYLFTRHTLLVPVAIPLLVQIPISLLAVVLSRYRGVRRQVAGEVEPGALPELVQAVCLSTDIENYVTASAALAPGDLAQLMGEYYENLSTLVARRKGLTMGRAGDSLMCVWTGSKSESSGSTPGSNEAPQDRVSDVRSRESACQAALEISHEIAHFNDRHATPLRTRIGLHVGDVALGGVGGEYHVVGDVPNTASRIQALNKQLGTTILASALVVRNQDKLYCRPVGRFVLPGRPGELTIAEIAGQSHAIDRATRDLCERFAAALAVFERGDLMKAGELFHAIAGEFPADGPARYYLALCAGDPSVARSANGSLVIHIESK